MRWVALAGRCEVPIRGFGGRRLAEETSVARGLLPEMPTAGFATMAGGRGGGAVGGGRSAHERVGDRCDRVVGATGVAQPHVDRMMRSGFARLAFGGPESGRWPAWRG